MNVDFRSASATAVLPPISLPASSQISSDTLKSSLQRSITPTPIEFENPTDNYSTHFEAEVVDYTMPSFKPFVDFNLDPLKLRSKKNILAEKFAEGGGGGKTLLSLGKGHKSRFGGKSFPALLCGDYKDLPDMSPSQSNDKNVYKGLRDYNNQEFDVAIARLLRAVSGQPNNALNHYLLGLCYAKTRKFKRATMEFGKSAKLDKTNALAFYNKGLSYANRADNDNALKELGKAIKIEKNIDFYKTRALVHRHCGNYKKAQKDYLACKLLEMQAGHKNLLTSIDVTKKIDSNPDVSESHTRTIQNNLMSTSKRRREKQQSDLKAKIYGLTHLALVCPAHERTPVQLDILVKESRMMRAFQHLDENQLRSLWQHLHYKKYTSNVRIFEEGDDADHFYVIYSGSVSARAKRVKPQLQLESQETQSPSQSKRKSAL